MLEAFWESSLIGGKDENACTVSFQYMFLPLLVWFSHVKYHSQMYRCKTPLRIADTTFQSAVICAEEAKGV